MKKSRTSPWMPASDYGRSLRGFGVNLLVAEIERAVAFQTEVLSAVVVYADEDFAVLETADSSWMLHADHTYSDHPLKGSLRPDMARGLGVELRLYQMDPDACEARARQRGDTVLAGAMDKPHGLREAYIVDPDGYLWVPGCALQDMS